MTKIISPEETLCNFISVKFINMSSTFPTLSQKYTSKIKTICDSFEVQSWILQCNMHGFSLWHSPTLINLNFSVHSKIKYFPDLSTSNRFVCLPISVNEKESVIIFVTVKKETKMQWLKQYRHLFLVL